MFPINFNFPYRKKDGSLITMEKALDGAGADLDLIDLDDVAVQTPADNEGLVYNGSTQKWKNEPVVTGDLWAENAAHNLLYNRTSGSNTVGGLTFTTNSDKSVTVGAGETASDDAIMLSGSSQTYSNSEQTLKKGTYTASINGGTVPVYLVIKVESDGVHDEQSIAITGNNVSTFTIDADCRIYAYLYINASGQTSAGGTLYPMIKRSSDPSTKYAPHAMTNGELTNMFHPSLKNSGLTPTYCSITEGGYYKIGNIVIVQMRISNSSDVQNRLISGFPPYSGVYNHVVLTGLDYETLINVPVTIDTDGILTVMDTTSNGVIITGCYII